MKDWEYYKTQSININLGLIRENLKEMEENIKSPIERIVYLYITDVFRTAIARRRIVVETQKKIGTYFADIYLERFRDGEVINRIIIECDGHDFHEKTKEQAAHDKKRDRFMNLEGYTLLRYTGSEIVNTPEMVIEDIFSYIGVTGNRGVDDGKAD